MSYGALQTTPLVIKNQNEENDEKKPLTSVSHLLFTILLSLI